jgi:hypothetical protein
MTAMDAIPVYTPAEVAALPAAERVAWACTKRHVCNEERINHLTDQGHFVAVFYPASNSLAAVAAATHILLFRFYKDDGFTDGTVDLDCIGVLSVADPAPPLPVALTGFTPNLLIVIDYPASLFACNGSLRNRAMPLVQHANALLLPPPPVIPLIPHPQGPLGPAAGVGGAAGGAGGGEGQARRPGAETQFEINAAFDVLGLYRGSDVFSALFYVPTAPPVPAGPLVAIAPAPLQPVLDCRPTNFLMSRVAHRLSLSAQLQHVHGLPQ